MPVFQVNYTPRMTSHLVKRGVFRANKFVLVDVGAREGYETYWDVFEDQIEVLGFEPDRSECERLNAESRHATYFPYALGKDEGEQALLVCKHVASSTLYTPNEKFWGRLDAASLFEPVETLTVRVRRLDNVLKETGTERIDLLKLDAEGSELDILQGAPSLLADATLLGIVSEIHFPRDVYEERPDGRSAVFSEIDEFLRHRGFELYDLDVYRFSRRAMPQPFLYDFVDQDGSSYPGQTIAGQIVTGDALYFRDFLAGRVQSSGIDGTQLLKRACLFEIFGLNDCAAELIVGFGSELEGIADPSHLLDLLTPEVRGKRYSYQQHMASYHNDPRRFRPTHGKRFPEYLVTHYDGCFVPVWEAEKWDTAKGAANTSIGDETETGGARLLARVASLEQELAQVYASRSWRYTEPIRRIMARLRQILRVRS